MLTDDEIKKRINEIYKFHNSRKGKYLRNYRRYCNTPKVGLENIKDPSIIGYWEYDMSPEVDTTIGGQSSDLKQANVTLPPTLNITPNDMNKSDGVVWS